MKKMKKIDARTEIMLFNLSDYRSIQTDIKTKF